MANIEKNIYISQPLPLTCAHKQKQLHWVQNYIKTNFQPWMVHMDVVVDGQWMTTIFHQRCNISKEVM